jgi:hypothetical protein
MSAWTGKGSKSRVTNYSNYWNSPLWDKEKKLETKALFLDDVREPKEAFLWDSNISLEDASGIPPFKWDIVRSYNEFVAYIQKNGIPDVVSFDNDLWNVQEELQRNPTSEKLAKQFQMIGWQDFDIKTGAHCAQYLVDACRAYNYNKPIPTYYIHSANSAARPIIREILENAKQNLQV